MIASAILLASAALSGASIPVWDSVRRFPDSSYWPGSGRQRTSAMLTSIRNEVGAELRSVGPGPQQLLARWKAGQLDREERVVVLLCGADYHDPALLPVYREALRSSDVRERRAALIGLHWLLGEPSSDATTIPEDSHAWDWAAGVADDLVRASAGRTLVEIWADSYLAAEGLTPSEPFVLRRKSADCLAAIREIATPDDLNTLVALWPLVADEPGRYKLMTTIEMVTLQKFLEITKSQRGGWGMSFYEASAKRVDNWIGSLCGAVDGGRLVRGKVEQAAREEGQSVLSSWLALSRNDYAPVWPTVAEQLLAFGAPVVNFNRQQTDDPKNEDAIRRVRERFPVSAARVGLQPQQQRPRPVR